MGSRDPVLSALCVQEPGVPPAVPAGREHSFGNAVRGSHGVTSPTFQFMDSRLLTEPDALCVREPISSHGGAVLLRSPDFGTARQRGTAQSRHVPRIAGVRRTKEWVFTAIVRLEEGRSNSDFEESLNAYVRITHR